jgi:pyruvate-formate lyase-activating enzyme
VRLIYADAGGRFYDHPEVRPAGRTGDGFCELLREDLIELPPGSSLVLIPGGRPVGISAGGRFLAVGEECRGNGPACAVAALLPQGYTRTLLPAFRRRKDDRPLPLLGYAAVAWHRGKVYAAALRTDEPARWDPLHYNTPELPALVERLLSELPANRILKQLAKCALDYGCFTAQNIFYTRWEGGVPVSASCNAKCLGCISLQPSECCPAPQSRITFTPSAGEVAGLVYRHLERADGAIVSFGQGCEGEPTLAAGLIRQAILEARHKTGRGTININTNAGNPAGLEILCRAGLDSIRVSLISAREEVYSRYCRPRGYNLADVRTSIKTAVSLGVYVSLNLLACPGLTDREEEVEALLGLVRETGVDMVQLRNLNIDPDYLFKRVPPAEGGTIGIPGLVEALKAVPGLEVGNFSRPLR